MSPCTYPNSEFIIICSANRNLTELLQVRYRSMVKQTAVSAPPPTTSSRSLGAYSESQHLVVLGIHGFAFFCSTARDGVAVRLCIKCNSSQLKYDVSLCLRDGREGNGNMQASNRAVFSRNTQTQLSPEFTQ